jgi:3-hydroxy-3-methylglutaryl CoA synthase
MKRFILIRNLDIRTLINDKELEREIMEQSKELYEQKTLPGLYFSQNMGNMYTPSVYYSLFAFLIRFILNYNQ